MDLDVRDLELLDVLAETGTLTAASDRLYVSQPALSQRLSKMEERLGIQLFDRLGRRLVPNTAGRRMLVAARHILTELASAERDVRDLRDGQSRRVRFAAQCSTTFYWLPPVIRGFRERHPEAEVRIESTPSDEPIAALLAERIDVALVCVPDQQTDRVRLTPMFEDEMVAVVSAHHPWAELDHVTAPDFDGVDLILYDSFDQTRIPAPQLPIPYGARPAKVITVPAFTDLVVEMVAGGEGVSILPTWVAEPYLATHPVRLIRVGSEPPTRTWYCATRAGTLPAHVAGFVAELTAGLTGKALTRSSAR